MCGIAGIVHFGRVPDAPVRARRMADAIIHRGPDDDGYWSDADVSLSFRRLSILDLATGAQPMANEDKSVWVIFNGEIYNHLELRRELIVKGHIFHTDHSDTEVLVHGYEEWGERLPERLNGMFAFALWDQRRRRLFLARDRHGIKPLYIAKLGDGTLIFGSEVRAVHASGLVPIATRAGGVIEYFSLMNFWHGRTPFAAVDLLGQGMTATVDPREFRSRRYWDYNFHRKSVRDRAQAVDWLRAILRDAIKRQVVADVPVTAYLSGGIDSSAITAAAYHHDPSVRGYSCIFDLGNVGEDRFVDEREFSRAVARGLAIDRVEHVVPQDALTHTLDATIHALEYPRMGMAYVNYLIAGRVARDAKVVLSGMGGDEMTGGYVSRYDLVAREHDGRSWLRKFAGSLWSGTDRTESGFDLYRAALNVPIPAKELANAFTPDILREVPGFDPVDVIRGTISKAPAEHPWDRVMYVDATTYMHGLLVLEDKLSMAHSLETRVPLLDNEVVDFLLGVPWEFLTDGKTGKILFREAVRAWVPALVADKPKMGFGPPDASWYRGALKPFVERMLSPKIIVARGVFQPEYVARKLDDHFSGRANNVALIWCLLSFESWCRLYGVFGGALTLKEYA